MELKFTKGPFIICRVQAWPGFSAPPPPTNNERSLIDLYFLTAIPKRQRLTMAQEKLLAPLKQSDGVRVKGRCVRVRTVDRFKRVIVTRAGKVVPFHLVKPGEFCHYFIKGCSKISLLTHLKY